MAASEGVVNGYSFDHTTTPFTFTSYYTQTLQLYPFSSSCYNNSTMVDPEEKRIREDVENLIDNDRLVNFSDAVFAFAATLLILKIDLPSLPYETVATNFTAELFKLWPEYLANLISFFIIAYYWRSHHAVFLLLRKFNSKIVWINIALLISVAFLPFPVDLFGDYYDIPAVTVFYSLSIALVGYLLLILWLYSVHAGLITKHISKRSIEYHTWNIAAAPLLFSVSIPITLIDHFIAKVSWILLIVVLIIIRKIYKGHHAATADLGPL